MQDETGERRQREHERVRLTVGRLGEGVHGAQIAALMRKLDELGYDGDYSFEVFNDDYVQLPLATVTARARQSVQWLLRQVPHRSLPFRRHRAA